MIARLLLSAFALLWGYNAIQMFECAYVRFAARRWYCSGYDNGVTGPAMGWLILTAVVLVLAWLWVWPFIRASRTRATKWDGMPQTAGERGPASNGTVPWDEKPLNDKGEAVLLDRYPTNPRKRMKARREAWHIIQQSKATAVLPDTPSGRLQNVKQLHDDGLITYDEYEAKRRAIIEEI